MADEPRRSGRATKGVHTKDREDSEDAPKQKGKAKGKKSKAEPEPEAEDEGEGGDELIRCVCGQYEEEEDNPRSMICCDKCSAWQHNDCMGLPEDYSPAKYFCEQCRPAAHKELLAAIARGEKPWEEVARRREEMLAEKASKKKGKKGSRKSGTATRVSDAQQRTPTLEPEEIVSSKKRKHDDSPAPDSKSKKARSSAAAAPAPPAEDREEEENEEDNKEERQAVVVKEIPESPQEPVHENPILANVAKDAKQIADPTRSKIASNIIKAFVEQANTLVQGGVVSLAKGETAKGLGTQIALQIEHAVYYVRSGNEGEPNDAYKDQIRTILNNIKTNPDLATRVMSKDLPADELAGMGPKDMATEEQKMKDAEEKLRMEKQHVLVEEQGPRIRRTHKGDEYVDDSTQVAESATSNAPVKKPSTVEQDVEMKSPIATDTANKPSTMRKPSAAGKGKPFVNAQRKSSSNFDINKVYAGVQGSPTDGEAPKLPEVQVARTPPPPAGQMPVADDEVDRLLKDEDNESEPYSPKDYVEEGVVWRGRVNGGSLGNFDTIARFAAGCQPDVDNLKMTWSQLIPSEIKLHGRIQPSKADDYLCGLEYSNTTELVIVSLAEPKESEDQAQFDKFFKYLKQKDRYGVGSQHQVPAIKDIYLLPMDAGQSLPTVMKALDHAFIDPIQERCFLVPIVIKWTELAHNAEKVRALALQQQAAHSPSVGPPVAQTPITPHEPQMMQFDPHPQAQSDQNQITNGAAHPQQHTTPTPVPVPAQYSTPPPQQQSSHAHAPVQVLTPQSRALSQQPQGQQSIAQITALRVLGPEMANLPSVVALVAQAPQAGENEFNIIKECIEENAEAGTSLPVLTQSLQRKHHEKRLGKEGERSGATGQTAVTAQT